MISSSIHMDLDISTEKVCTNTRIAALTWDDLKLGDVLGEGSFSSVHRVAASNKRGRELLGTTETQATKHYALKCLHEKVICDEDLCKAAAKDLAFEVTILAILPFHENIIRIRGISAGFWDKPEKGFVIIDLLQETLDFRLSHWRKQGKQARVPLFGRQRQRCRDQQARVNYAALGIAKGVEFLHQNRVIYRDLKPKNIGFDQDGRVQIFDFGLARIIPKGTDDRRMTGLTGSLRYMAPEVARRDDYAFPADIHSFAILLWEICTLQTPFAKITTTASVFGQIVHGGVRPAIQKIGSKRLRELLQACWHPHPDTRPSIAMVVDQLQLEINTDATSPRDLCASCPPPLQQPERPLYLPTSASAA
jgi:serine/threonine protein kinase